MNTFKCKAYWKYVVPVMVLCFSVLFIDPVVVNAEDELMFAASPIFVSHPQHAYVYVGDYAVFSVETSDANCTYQWQYNAGDEWKNSSMTGYNTNSIEVEGTDLRDGYLYRCTVTDSSGTKHISNAALLTIVSEEIDTSFSYHFYDNLETSDGVPGIANWTITYEGNQRPLVYLVRSYNHLIRHYEFSFLIPANAEFTIGFGGAKSYEDGNSSTIDFQYYTNEMVQSGSYMDNYASGVVKLKHGTDGYYLVSFGHYVDNTGGALQDPYILNIPMYAHIDKKIYTWSDALGVANEVLNGRQPNRDEFWNDTFFESGGTIYEPSDDPSFSNYHNFSKDIINPDIPIPQLTNISHEGFTLGNRDGYSAEVIVESQLLGTKFESQTIGMGMSSPWHFVPDTNWIYATNYYNFADSSEVLVGSDSFNIKDLYGVDNVSDLIEDFKSWSTEYPKANKLPSYTWLKSGWNHIYIQHHVYSDESELSAAEQLKKSGQARTSYFVRYVSSDGSTGQWVKYSFTDAYGTINNGMVYEGSLSVGAVEPDVNGNPIVKDEISGSVNYENGGSVQYTPPANATPPTVSQDELDASLSGFQSTLEQFGESTATVSRFTSEMFSFLPGWCTALIGLGITGVFILRFLGR